jgi:hypothetical protein
MKVASEPERQHDRYTDVKSLTAVPCWQLHRTVENIRLGICDIMCPIF